MDLEAVRALTNDLSFDVLGIAATLTPPFAAPVSSRIIWLRNIPEDLPTGRDYGRLGVRRRMAIKRNGFSEIPRATVVNVPEKLGSPATDWQVDGIEEVAREHFKVFVVPRTGVV